MDVLQQQEKWTTVNHIKSCSAGEGNVMYLGKFEGQYVLPAFYVKSDVEVRESNNKATTNIAKDNGTKWDVCLNNTIDKLINIDFEIHLKCYEFFAHYLKIKENTFLCL